ncbi:TfpX/TfpZ family type IV pilin accessory protein [Acinetobacter venetianus]|uniref:TfpX/TfpZ family type IV pilin accessory protein n=1 Tax=Acinetobacter venetianus TaxID=52133 RepID=UPI0035BE6334
MTSRNKFALGHLLISLFIASFIVALVFFIWYPYPLGKATGVTPIFLMMVGIDIILGPLLTWFVYKDGKKSLKFDLAVIILIQIAALFYGVFHIADGRPVWLVYSVDRFEVVRNNEIYTKNIQQANKIYQHPSWFGPQYVAIKFAKEPNKRRQDMFDEILGGVEISQRPERYVELSQVTDQIKMRVQGLTLLNQYNDPVIVKETLIKYPQADSFVPLKANAVDMSVLINKEKGEVVKIVDLRPWN